MKILVALGAVVLAGCASLTVRSYVPRGMDLRQYHTYNWEGAAALSTGDPRLDNNPFFDERVRADVDKRLAARGFEKTTAGTPDLVVHYHASITQKIDSLNIDRQYRYSDETEPRPYLYDAGTLLIDFVDPRTNKLVWRGWVEGSLERVIDDQQRLENAIDDAVTRILSSLPSGL